MTYSDLARVRHGLFSFILCSPKRNIGRVDTKPVKAKMLIGVEHGPLNKRREFLVGVDRICVCWGHDRRRW